MNRTYITYMTYSTYTAYESTAARPTHYASSASFGSPRGSAAGRPTLFSFDSGAIRRGIVEAVHGFQHMVPQRP